MTLFRTSTVIIVVIFMNIKLNKKREVGLIFGKFYPLHCGHIYLIEKAISQVDELHVILGCEQTRDRQLFEKSHMTKQPQVKDRFYWLKNTFKNRHNIHIYVLDEEGINYYPNGWKDWSNRVKLLLADHLVIPTVVFTSELQDVKNHEHYFNCSVKLIDVNRDFINISATEIRQNPYHNWQYIARAAKPFFIKKIALIGKQNKFEELAKQLANIYNTVYVPNGYINYIYHDHLSNESLMLNDVDHIRIAMLHAQRIDEAAIIANRVLFTTLDFNTLHQYYQKSFNQENKTILDLEENYYFDLVIHDYDFNESESQLEIFEKVIKLVEQQLT